MGAGAAAVSRPRFGRALGWVSLGYAFTMVLRCVITNLMVPEAGRSGAHAFSAKAVWKLTLRHDRNLSALLSR